MNPPYQLKSVCQSDHEFCVSNELRHGQQAVTDLLRLMRLRIDSSNANVDTLHPAFGLVTKIIDSFSNSLSMLGSQDPVMARVPRASSKTSSLSSGNKMCHKPSCRKGDSWTQVTSDLNTDGYSWRKYGQKPILNAKHPRSYYKCANRPHCQALKRVQKMDDEPPMFRITHTGHHTCENPPSTTSFSDMDSKISFNFENQKNEQSVKLEKVVTLSSSLRKVKGSEECKNQQSRLNPNNLPLLEDMETTKKVHWSLDDYDYLIGSLEFNDRHT